MKRYPASRCPITIGKGADFEKVWVFYPEGVDAAARDWTGYTAVAQLRTSPQAATALLSFTTTLGADGSVRIATTHTATAGLSSGEAVWDLYTTDPDGKVDRFMAGPATITNRVTRP